MYGHVRCRCLLAMPILKQNKTKTRLVFPFPLRKIVIEIRGIFITPTWLKLRLFLILLLPRHQKPVREQGLAGAWWLHTMDWDQSNLTPVCSSMSALKHKSEHSVERFWHWLHDNHRFCIQTLPDKKLIASMKGTLAAKSMSDRCHDAQTYDPLFTSRALLQCWSRTFLWGFVNA